MVDLQIGNCVLGSVARAALFCEICPTSLSLFWVQYQSMAGIYSSARCWWSNSALLMNGCWPGAGVNSTTDTYLYKLAAGVARVRQGMDLKNQEIVGTVGTEHILRWHGPDTSTYLCTCGCTWHRQKLATCRCKQLTSNGLSFASGSEKSRTVLIVWGSHNV